jgi:hypothetical protein
MIDPVHAALKWISHNRYLFYGLVIAGSTSAYLFACESRTTSLTDPARQVTRSGFQAEAAKVESDLVSAKAKLDSDIAAFNARVDATNATIEAGATDLNRQDEIRAQIVNTITGLVPNLIGGSFNPAQLLGTATGLLGLFAGGGAVLDNKRKDRLLALKKAAPPAA